MMVNSISIGVETSEDYGFVNQGGNYYFYDRALGKSPRLYQHILSTATSRIDIWDPYFTLQAANVFDEVKQKDIKINVLTKLNLFGNQKVTDVDDFADMIKNVLKGNGVVPKLYINCYTNKSFDNIWHDRYLIIDEKEVYLIGSSIDDQINPCKNFGIYHITLSADCDLIKSKMKECKDSCIKAGPTRNSYVRN